MIGERRRTGGVLFAALTLVILALSCGRQETAPATPALATATTDGDYDLKFLATMVHHHRHAIEIWQLVAERAGHPELRRYADKAIAEQNREIVLMDMWRAPSPVEQR